MYHVSLRVSVEKYSKADLPASDIADIPSSRVLGVIDIDGYVIGIDVKLPMVLIVFSPESSRRARSALCAAVLIASTTGHSNNSARTASNRAIPSSQALIKLSSVMLSGIDTVLRPKSHP